jgi:CelD/BcsL family acetyltransferase involved in cellulose biosynthesis
MNGVNSQFGGLGADVSVAKVYAPATTGSWAFSIARGVAGLAALHGEWQAMLDRQEATSFVQSPAWFASYLQALARRPDAVLFVAARNAGRLLGVLALEQSTHGPAGLGPTSLRLITGDHMPLADIAGDTITAGLWPAVHQWLERDSGLSWSALFAPGLCADSCLARWQRNSPDHLRGVVQPTAPSLWLDCSVDVKHALRDVSRSHTVNVRRLMKRAKELGSLQYEVVTAPDKLEQAFESFLQVESSGWKGAQGTAIRLHSDLVAFYRSLMKQFGERGECRINLLRLNGEVIAAQFGLVAGRQLSLLKIGYLQKHANIAPGHLIMQHTIESVCADPALDRLSFVTQPVWAHLWKPEATGVEHHVVFRTSWSGRLLREGLRLWQRRPRRTPPAPKPLPSRACAATEP